MDRKKFLTIALIVALLASSSALGITLAYFGSNLEKRANNFSFSNVRIELKEEKWDALSDSQKIVYPGRSVEKDPKIINTGDSSVYAYLEVHIPVAEVKTVADDESIVSNGKIELFSFETNDGWTKLEALSENDDDFVKYVYAYTESDLAAGESTNTLFDTVQFVDMLEGELPMGTELVIPVYAYAIQSEYLEGQDGGLTENMTSAFNQYKAEQAKQ